MPRAGFTIPALYRKNCYIRESDYTASIKVRVNNTWDWVTADFRKSDADYILKHCSGRKECVPVLRKRGRKWYLDFSFEEKTKLHDTPAEDQLVLAVDLGINNACTCSVLAADGTVAGRGFLSLPAENDCLEKATGRIRKAQRNGAKRMPRLWARAKGISDAIAVNPCPCGYLGDENHPCTCTRTQIDKYRARLSGPLCERIDMCVEIRRVSYDSLTAPLTGSSYDPDAASGGRRLSTDAA